MGTPVSVVVFRHGEKPQGADPNLSNRGRQRAAALAFGLPEAVGNPDFLIATKDSENSDRPLQTIRPLAQTLGLTVDVDFGDHEYEKVASLLFGKDKYAGKRVAICWHHGTIPELVAALGVRPVPPPWNPSVFDRYLKITFDAAAKATLTDLPQKLLYQDSAT